MSNLAIKVENLSKRYRIGLVEERHDTFFGAISGWIKSPFKNYRRVKKLSSFSESAESEDIIWALKDVSFEVKKGEVLGIIGRNGAGKSTLLKILSRITEPTSGFAEIHGRISSLLEVGTGFHPELTGRENVYLNGTILGMTKSEIDRKFDEIVEFSGIEKFIETPVKRYSSGMRVRLAFSVAAHLEPEILLIDEVLAVGDAQFQRKCLGKMDTISKEGRTVLFVSHNMSAVKSLCGRGILLDLGALIVDREIGSVIHEYTNMSLGMYSKHVEVNQKQNDITLRTISISKEEIISGDSFELSFNFSKHDNMEYLVDLTFHIVDEYGNLVFVGSTGKNNSSTNLKNGQIIATCNIPEFLMNEGVYSIHRLLFVKDHGTIIFELRDCFSFRIFPNKKQLGWMGKEEGIINPKLNWEVSVR